VVVLELGGTRAVIKDIGVGDHWLNVIFNQSFTAVLSKLPSDGLTQGREVELDAVHYICDIYSAVQSNRTMAATRPERLLHRIRGDPVRPRDGASHGYAIIKEIEELTDGEMSPHTGSMYLASAQAARGRTDRRSPDERRRCSAAILQASDCGKGSCSPRSASPRPARESRICQAAHPKERAMTNVLKSVFRVSLHLFPISFRDGYADEMEEIFAERIACLSPLAASAATLA
jgi:hypothetical protein